MSNVVTAKHIFVLTYLLYRSTHNVCMERAWKDVRKETTEVYRQIFLHLENELHVLDMQNPIHRLCLYLVFQPRIQASLNNTAAAWNLHRMRTEGSKSPWSIWQLSREKGIRQGWWTGDPGDDLHEVDEDYGIDPEAPLPPIDVLEVDPVADGPEYANLEQEWDAGVFLNEDQDIYEARRALEGFDFEAEDGNWGIDIYMTSIVYLGALWGINN